MFDCDCNLIFVFHQLWTNQRKTFSLILFASPQFSVNFHVIAYLLINFVSVKTTSLNLISHEQIHLLNFISWHTEKRSVFLSLRLYNRSEKNSTKLSPYRPERKLFFIHFNAKQLHTSRSSYFSFSFTKTRLFSSPFLGQCSKEKRNFIWCLVPREFDTFMQSTPGRARGNCKNFHTKAPCLRRRNFQTEINTIRTRAQNKYFMFQYGNFMLKCIRMHIGSSRFFQK